jgi:hypothetical protein
VQQIFNLDTTIVCAENRFLVVVVVAIPKVNEVSARLLPASHTTVEIV